MLIATPSKTQPAGSRLGGRRLGRSGRSRFTGRRGRRTSQSPLAPTNGGFRFDSRRHRRDPACWRSKRRPSSTARGRFPARRVPDRRVLGGTGPRTFTGFADAPVRQQRPLADSIWKRQRTQVRTVVPDVGRLRRTGRPGTVGLAERGARGQPTDGRPPRGPYLRTSRRTAGLPVGPRRGSAPPTQRTSDAGPASHLPRRRPPRLIPPPRRPRMTAALAALLFFPAAPAEPAPLAYAPAPADNPLKGLAPYRKPRPGAVSVRDGVQLSAALGIDDRTGLVRLGAAGRVVERRRLAWPAHGLSGVPRIPRRAERRAEVPDRRRRRNRSLERRRGRRDRHPGLRRPAGAGRPHKVCRRPRREIRRRPADRLRHRRPAGEVGRVARLPAGRTLRLEIRATGRAGRVRRGVQEDPRAAPLPRRGGR